MEEIVKYIVSQLVEKTEEVSVTTTVDGDYNVILVNVAEDEIGKVIGKNGRIAQSIRAIVRSIASKSGKKYAIKIGNKE